MGLILDARSSLSNLFLQGLLGQLQMGDCAGARSNGSDSFKLKTFR